MAHSEEDRKKFLETLAATPFIRHAARKAGIHPSTIYNWMECDPDFKKKLKRALKSGRSSLVEVGEVALVNKVRDGDMGAIKYLLANNSKRYGSKIPLRPPEPKEDEPPRPVWDGQVTVSKATADIIERLRKSEEQVRRNNPDLEGPTD